MERIIELFNNDIERHIEEVIKVDQANEAVIENEIKEYVTTDSIKRHFTNVLDRYWETPNKPHEGVAVWVSGFFGSGKSSFAKMLGLAIENREIMGKGAAELFGKRTGDDKIQVLLSNIKEQIPTEAVIFDVSTDKGVRSGNQTIIEIMYRLFLQQLGYARDLDLSDLEITLEDEGQLEAFKEVYKETFSKDWDKEKGKVAFAIQEASVVMNKFQPNKFTTPDSWREAAHNRSDVSAGSLAERCKKLMAKRRPGKNLVFVIDEVGQFVARDVQKMLDLQGVVQSLGRVGQGKMWIVVTSQEKLNEMVTGLDDSRVEISRLMDRFPLQVHLEPTDISEVTSKRVLSKTAAGQRALRELLEKHRGRLADNTKLSADIALPEITANRFAELYPLLPYQIDLIIQVVSGLRTRGGAIQHVGGANRTIIKLAQQLLVHPDVNLAQKPLGHLVTIDRIYDLVSGNIPSEIRSKIDEMKRGVEHWLAAPVAKAICLLQYVQSIHRTAENIAATLHPAVDADSLLPEVKEALQVMAEAKQIRLGDDGYRIPTPAEDDWERQRSGVKPKPGDMARIHREFISELWKPQPSHNLRGAKVFKAGLFFNDRQVLEGDVPFYVHLAENGDDFKERAEELRKHSQEEGKAVFWVAGLDTAIDHETVELFRSREILSRKERGAQTKAENSLVAEEKSRQRRHGDELKRLLRQALLTGQVYFRGNDRSPDESVTEVTKAAENILAKALPEVFDRFEEAAAKVKKNDIEALMKAEDLRGLPPLFNELGLVKDHDGKVVFNVETGPLKEIQARVENRTSYGETAGGRWLADEFSKEPFGWDFDMVRLLAVCLVRAGKLTATSKGQIIESAVGVEARNTFGDNNKFRSASFQPRVDECEYTDLLDACKAYKETFGEDIPEIELGVVAATIQERTGDYEDLLSEMNILLEKAGLYGTEALGQALNTLRAIKRAKQCQAVLTFNSSFKKLDETIRRAQDLQKSLNEAGVAVIRRGRKALDGLWPVLDTEKDLDDSFRDTADELRDLMNRETFYKELAEIDQKAKILEDEHELRYEKAVQARTECYAEAMDQLKGLSDYNLLNEDQRVMVREPLAGYDTPPEAPVPISLLRSEVEACKSRLDEALAKAAEMATTRPTVRVKASDYFKGGVETEEQLEAALTGLREKCEELIGAGNKVLIQ